MAEPEPIQPNNKDIAPDQIKSQTWDEAVSDPQNESSAFGTGISPIAKPYQSLNFVSGLRGWRINSNGDAEFNNGIFRGTFVLGGVLITINNITLLQSSITAVSTAGGGIVSLEPGTYNATSSFTIPSNVTIDGNGATIDFGGGAYQFLIQGTNAYSTGTLAVSYGSANVVGTGTTWTAGMVGQSILIGDYWYTILTRTDNTHITIQYSSGNGFLGTTVSGASYVIGTTVDGAKIKNITLTNSSTTLLKFRYCNGFTMDTVNTTNSAQGVDGDDSSNVLLLTGLIDDCTVGLTYNNIPFSTVNSMVVTNITGGTGMDFNGISNTAISIISIQGITGVGIKFTNCYNLCYDLSSIIECTSHGMEFVSGNRDNDVISGYIDTVGGDGIKLTATSDTTHIYSQSILNYSGYGINIANANCDNNIIDGISYGGGGSGTLNDSGTGTVVLDNPMTTTGDIIYRASTNFPTRLGIGSTNTVIHGGTIPSYSSVVEADITLTDNTTNNVSTSAHGFMKKLPNDATKFYDGTGAFSTPTGGASLNEVPNTNATSNTYYTYQVPLLGLSATTRAGWATANSMGALLANGAGGYDSLVSAGNSRIQTPIPGTGSASQYVATKAISVKYRLRLNTTSNVKGWGVAVSGSFDADQTLTSEGMRFVENAGILYAWVSDGTTAATTDVSAGITRTNWNTYEIVFTPSTSVLFYINGTLVATKTLNIPGPGGATLLLGYGISTNTQFIDTFPPIISLAI